MLALNFEDANAFVKNRSTNKTVKAIPCYELRNPTVRFWTALASRDVESWYRIMVPVKITCNPNPSSGVIAHVKDELRQMTKLTPDRDNTRFLSQNVSYSSLSLRFSKQ